MRMHIWSDIVRGTTSGPAVFEVLPEHRQRVRDWAAARARAHAAQRDVHSPAVEGWAVLDGGVTTVSGYGLTTLPHGVRVIGFGALRLLLDDLGAPGPDGPFPGEPFPGGAPVPADELRRRNDAIPRAAPETVEQAQFLAACSDALMLRFVATTLSREAAARPVPPIPHPAGPPSVEVVGAAERTVPGTGAAPAPAPAVDGDVADRAAAGTAPDGTEPVRTERRAGAAETGPRTAPMPVPPDHPRTDPVGTAPLARPGGPDTAETETPQRGVRHSSPGFRRRRKRAGRRPSQR